MKETQLTENLRSLLESSGPFVSLYLNTEAARELGPKELGLRWRNFRDVVAEKVPDKALLHVDDIVEGAHRHGDGLVVITAAEEVGFRRYLGSPIVDRVEAGPLPHLLPLLEWVQDHPAYIVVLIDRKGADIHLVSPLEEEVTIEIEGGHDELRKVSPGGWSQRRFQNRAEDSWEQNAEEVATALTKVVEAEAIELAIVMGDVRAASFLEENVGPNIKPVLHHLDTAPPTADSLDWVQAEIEAAVAQLVARSDKEILERFLEERGQDDLAADGVVTTLTALRMSQVDTLLISRVERTADGWFSKSDLTQGAETKSVLSDIGLEDLEKAPIDDVLVRLAVGTGAKVRVIPDLSAEQGPTDGVGAILRFRTS